MSNNDKHIAAPMGLYGIKCKRTRMSSGKRYGKKGLTLKRHVTKRNMKTEIITANKIQLIWPYYPGLLGAWFYAYEYVCVLCTIYIDIHLYAVLRYYTDRLNAFPLIPVVSSSFSFQVWMCVCACACMLTCARVLDDTLFVLYVCIIYICMCVCVY